MNDMNQSDFFFVTHSVHILKIIISTNTWATLNTFRSKYQTPTYNGTGGGEAPSWSLPEQHQHANRGICIADTGIIKILQF